MRCPLLSNTLPKASIKVLFPTPGTPVIPNLQAPPEYGMSLFTNLLASFLNSGELFSIKVMAEDKAARSFDNNRGNNLSHVKLSNRSFRLCLQSSIKESSTIILIVLARAKQIEHSSEHLKLKHPSYNKEHKQFYYHDQLKFHAHFYLV